MTISIAVASGKGGVGKTNCAVNLSLSLTKMGKKVVLFDTDFGMANAHILLGTNPKHTAADFLRGTAGLESILSDGPSDLRFIAGGSGLLELLNLDNHARYQMLQSLSELENEIDYLVVDTPAGASESSLFFASAVAVPLIVLVAEPTSFLDAYAFIKAAHIEKNIQNSIAPAHAPYFMDHFDILIFSRSPRFPDETCSTVLKDRKILILKLSLM